MKKNNELANPVTMDDDNDENSFNPMGNLMKLGAIKYNEPPTLYNTPAQEPVKKSTGGRPKKLVTADTEKKISKDAKTPLNSNEPYYKTYAVPTKMLIQTAIQIEDLSNKIKQDLDAVRCTKYLKNKYGYITDLSATLTSLYGNEISVANAISNTITNSHRLELSKHKELTATTEPEDEDKKLMQYFNAFMNTPMGAAPQGMMERTIPPEVLNGGINNGVPITTGDSGAQVANDDAGYQEYLKNMTPEQNAMVQSTNPNIETVLVYDQSTHEKWFEVLDVRTGEQIPNVQLPPDFIRDGCNVDIRNGIARNPSYNKNFRLKLVGTRMTDEF